MKKKEESKSFLIDKVVTEEDTFSALKKSPWSTVNNELVYRCKGYMWTHPLVAHIAIKHGWTVTELYDVYIGVNEN